MSQAELKKRLQNIRMLLTDVDGVHTDGRLILSGSDEMKTFHVHDGLGLVLASHAGLKLGMITGRESEAVQRRARELHVDVLHQGVRNKLDSYFKIIAANDLQDEAICYMGDDLTDLPVMKRAGIAVAPANARDEVKHIADVVTCASGGSGAVREIVELILKSQNLWQDIIQRETT